MTDQPTDFEKMLMDYLIHSRTLNEILLIDKNETVGEILEKELIKRENIINHELIANTSVDSLNDNEKQLLKEIEAMDKTILNGIKDKINYSRSLSLTTERQKSLLIYHKV